MVSIWDESTRHQLLTRLDGLAADTPSRWGKFTCPGMLAHLNDSLRMSLGELTPAPKHLPIRFFPLKQLIIYVLPFPKGAPTAPELIARRETAVWSGELTGFRELLGRLAAKPAAGPWPDHPAFGRMSRTDWGVLVYKHVNHHFTQFGG
jgi:hypothetical protein